MAQFKSDFLYKLQRNINDAIDRIDELNRALKNARFGNDTYRFKVEPAPEYREYYDMITSDLLMNGDNTLFLMNSQTNIRAHSIVFFSDNMPFGQ